MLFQINQLFDRPWFFRKSKDNNFGFIETNTKKRKRTYRDFVTITFFSDESVNL